MMNVEIWDMKYLMHIFIRYLSFLFTMLIMLIINLIHVFLFSSSQIRETGSNAKTKGQLVEMFELTLN